MVSPTELMGQATAVQDPVKKGIIVEAEMVPLYPELHVQPAGTLLPAAFVGHDTAVHDPVKKGVVVETSMVPLYPALHVQPT